MSAFPDIEKLTDAESLAHYGRDWTRFWAPEPSAVVFPRATEDVVRLVEWARAGKAALVPSGGRTGLSGGAVAPGGEVVVSFEKMRSIKHLDVTEPSITVAAGTTIGEVQRHAAENSLYYPVDWAAAESSQAGGSVATNAGGIRVLRYGMTRDWVRGLTVVTGAGDVLELNRGLVKNNAGLDLRHLMVGSEGTLGLITEVTFGLVDTPPQRSVLLLAFSGLEAIMPAFGPCAPGWSCRHSNSSMPPAPNTSLAPQTKDFRWKRRRRSSLWSSSTIPMSVARRPRWRCSKSWPKTATWSTA